MTKQSYENLRGVLLQLTEIAEMAILTHPPKQTNSAGVNALVSFYKEMRSQILSPFPQHKNLTTLRSSMHDALVFFQEGSGDAVEFFWREVRTRDLPVVRENKLAKILKRQKIRNREEYDFITDVIVPYQQDGLISADEVKILNSLIASFESSKR